MPRSQRFSAGLLLLVLHSHAAHARQPQHSAANPRRSRQAESSVAPAPDTARSQARGAGHPQGNAERHHERLPLPRRYPRSPARGAPPGAAPPPPLPGSQVTREPLRDLGPPRPQGAASSRAAATPLAAPQAPTERRRPRAGYCPPPSRPRPQKVSLPGPHRSLSLRRRERQPRRPTAPRERAPPTNTRRREAGPRGPPARLSGGSASRRAGSAPRLPPRPRGTPLTGNPPLPSPAPGAGRASPLPASRQPEPGRGSRQAPSGAAGRRLGRPLRPRPLLRPPPLLPGP